MRFKCLFVGLVALATYFAPTTPALAQSRSSADKALAHLACEPLLPPPELPPAETRDENVFYLVPEPPSADDFYHDEVWIEAPSSWARHAEFRSRAGFSMPGEGQIWLFQDQGHNGSTESSLVAWKPADGRWHVDEVVLERGDVRGQLDERGFLRRTFWIMSDSETRAVDALLDDPCLSNDPRSNDRWTGTVSGAWDQYVEITTADDHMSFYRRIDSYGRVGRLVQALNASRPVDDGHYF